ncbi:Metal resistance protein YCF1 [Trichoderma ghanense]|uniref:Metal resistance protein YCF1 n=1 Tax=Trichoderma ghanense TaxID=65468 RepID=A0ABY2HHA5_9HYPO
MASDGEKALFLSLTSATSLAFLLLGSYRLWALRHEKIKVEPNWLAVVKPLVALPLPAILLSDLVLALSQGRTECLGIVSRSAALAASVGLVWLSIAEHKRSIRPSNLIVLYLLLTIVFDTFALTYPGFSNVRSGGRNHALLVAEVASRAAMLLLESQDKTSILRSEYGRASPEETAGLISSVLFWWLNGLLSRGNRSILRGSHLPPLDSGLEAEGLRRKILETWENRSNKSESILTLLKVLLRCLAGPFFAATFPRLGLVIFRCGQPILIEKAVRFVQGYTQGDDARDGYWLVVAAAFVYLGQTLSHARYFHLTNRLELMTRASLTTLIYNKALNIGSHAAETGKVITIMSTDVDGAVEAGRMVHEAWAKLFELVLGVVLLVRQVKWLAPLPFIIIIFCSQVSRYVAKNIRVRQKGWNMATQRRISVLSSILGSMKSVKALGVSGAIMSYIDQLREDEIKASKNVRFMNAVYNASANALGIFAPVATIVVYAAVARLQGSQLNVSTAFTTVAILALVTEPANMIMTIVPNAVATSANFERIQAYLLEPPRTDTRRVTTPSSDASRAHPTAAAVRLDGVTVASPTAKDTLLQNINLVLPRGSVTTCSGPVGSGKSTLAKVILGEIAPSEGTITVSSASIGYCDQQAWLPTGTVKQIVGGFSTVIDKERCDAAIRACCLDHDLAGFPDGDETVVGSRGINLSGGQRQRLALARLVYSLHDIVVLDDPFSALDGNTENTVVDNLLGPNGWFKKNNTAVFLVTNSAQHFHVADEILVLEKGRLATRGSWDELKSSVSELTKFTFAQAMQKPEVTAAKTLKGKSQSTTDAEEDLYRKTGDFSLYSYYLKSAGTINVVMLLICTASYSFGMFFPQYLLKWWTEGPPDKSSYYMAGYIALAVLAWVATNGSTWSTNIMIAPRSGALLHRSLLRTIFGAPLLFFSTTDIGIILNSQDISYVDRQLPFALITVSTQMFKMLFQLVLILNIQRWLTVCLPICVVAVYLIQRIYLRTSRQLRVLELEYQSSLYQWFLETAEGAVTIRSFGWSLAAEEKNVEALNWALRPRYTLMCVQRWLSLVLNLIVNGIAIGLIVLAVRWRGTTTGGDIGAALNLILAANATLVRLVESWASLEVSLGAIARLRNVERYTPKEDRPEEDLATYAGWPTKGEAQIAHLDAGYSPEHQILHDVNIDVKAGQRLVICGRTGSGKSTIIAALLRLIDGTGVLKVDGQDLLRTPRSVVRRKCFITITQEPFLIPQATLRFNLDPHSIVSDQVLEEALQKVGIWPLLSSKSGTAADILNSQLSALPALSSGQSQLLAVARAIVRKYALAAESDYPGADAPKPILLLDEATSSLDSETEDLIYGVLEREFVREGYTAVIVAHRLSVVLGRWRPERDRIAWVEDGRVAKVGSYEEIIELASRE